MPLSGHSLFQEFLRMPAELKIVENNRENLGYDPLLTPEQVAKWLNTSIDWVWDHSSRKSPLLQVIRFGEGPGRSGILRYRASKIEEFIAEQEAIFRSPAAGTLAVE
jgi:hypothetical protein